MFPWLYRSWMCVCEAFSTRPRQSSRKQRRQIGASEHSEGSGALRSQRRRGDSWHRRKVRSEPCKDASGGWEFYSATNRAIVSGGARYVWISGTSMSSPHVAGVAALIRQVYPKLSPGAVAAKIRESATSMPCPTDWPSDDHRQCTSEDGKTSFFGAGMVNAGAAVQ